MSEKAPVYRPGEYVSVLSAMERNVRAHPDRIAISDKKTELSYRQLHEAAGIRAYALRQCRCCRNRCIAVLSDQSADTIVNLLAVLYSGNHYILLDGQMPLQMRQTILSHCAAELLLSSGAISTPEGSTLMDLSSIESTGAPTLFESLGCDDPLFAVATSGTTGTPKLIVKSCGSMSLFIGSYLRQFCVTDSDVIGNGIPFYSDASAKDIYAMIYGAVRMVIIPPWFFSMPFPLIGLMNSRQITLISWVPSAYSLVKRFDILKNCSLTTLRTGIFIGEDIPPDTLLYWMEHVPDARFYNTYGMSELAGICACAQLDSTCTAHFPIGHPLEHCRMICVDEQGLPAQQGRLLVSSDALAMGYRDGDGFVPLRRMELSLPDGETDRYYDTGDLCRIREDGAFELLGRADFQIKHLGYRIELQGIESVILRCENVHQALCLYEDKTLVAVIQLNEDTPQHRQMFEVACEEQLPRYMLPSVYCYRTEMPLNRNGKIDRASLRADWKG